MHPASLIFYTKLPGTGTELLALCSHVRIHSSRAVLALREIYSLVQIAWFKSCCMTVLIPKRGSVSAVGDTWTTYTVCFPHLTADVFDFTLKSGSGSVSVQPGPRSASPREICCLQSPHAALPLGGLSGMAAPGAGSIWRSASTYAVCLPRK